MSTIAARARWVALRALSIVAPGVAARTAERLWFTPRYLTIPDAARAFLDSGERFTRDVDGCSVVAWRWGAGPTVILAHGWGGYGAQLQPFVDPLVAAGYEVILFDALAHGESDRNRDGSRESTLFDFAKALDAIAKDSPRLSAIVAHSGACTAAAWALTNAHWKPSSIVFIAPMASPRRYQVLFQRALGFTDGVMRRFAANAERRFSFRWDDFEVPEMAARMQTPPVLLIHDRQDRETSFRDSEEIAAAWPNAQLRLTSGLGHVRILREPAVVVAVTDFVRKPV